MTTLECPIRKSSAQELPRTGDTTGYHCNTMRAQEVTLKDLLPGFVVADKGGVVRIAELQAQGYLISKAVKFCRRPEARIVALPLRKQRPAAPVVIGGLECDPGY
jgi:hypothetical protein